MIWTGFLLIRRSIPFWLDLPLYLTCFCYFNMSYIVRINETSCFKTSSDLFILRIFFINNIDSSSLQSAILDKSSDVSRFLSFECSLKNFSFFVSNVLTRETDEETPKYFNKDFVRSDHLLENDLNCCITYRVCMSLALSLIIILFFFRTSFSYLIIPTLWVVFHSTYWFVARETDVLIIQYVHRESDANTWSHVNSSGRFCVQSRSWYVYYRCVVRSASFAWIIITSITISPFVYLIYTVIYSSSICHCMLAFWLFGVLFKIGIVLRHICNFSLRRVLFIRTVLLTISVSSITDTISTNWQSQKIRFPKMKGYLVKDKSTSCHRSRDRSWQDASERLSDAVREIVLDNDSQIEWCDCSEYESTWSDSKNEQRIKSETQTWDWEKKS